MDRRPEMGTPSAASLSMKLLFVNHAVAVFVLFALA